MEFVAGETLENLIKRSAIVEDRLLAEASQGSEVQKLVEQLNLDKRISSKG